MSLRASSPFGGARSQEHLEVVAGPPGTYSPGTVLEVNHTQVIVERFLAEGGFAHVYVVRTESYEELVLKRTACPDEDSLEDLKNEIDVMRTVSGHKNIVQYYDSSIAPMRHGGYEIFILMENCSGGHLVDLLNSRLHTRLTEAEILSIFSDVCEAVAHLHYHPRGPILHRDIKVENVLIASDGTYKLCDFGSSTRKIIPAGSSLSMPEIRKLEADIDRFTTLQYRAPELCDLYQRKGISEKVDIWALGILLFKLCYLTTPFEDNGKMAILNVRYTVPPFPIYSHAFTYLIQSMLKSEVGERASIHQVFSMVCSLRGVPCHLQEMPERERSFNQPTSQLSHPSAVITARNPAVVPTTSARPPPPPPPITPMRRGRPQKTAITPASPSNTAPGLLPPPSASSLSLSQSLKPQPSTPSLNRLPPPKDPSPQRSLDVEDLLNLSELSIGQVKGAPPSKTELVGDSIWGDLQWPSDAPTSSESTDANALAWPVVEPVRASSEGKPPSSPLSKRPPPPPPPSKRVGVAAANGAAPASSRPLPPTPVISPRSSSISQLGPPPKPLRNPPEPPPSRTTSGTRLGKDHSAGLTGDISSVKAESNGFLFGNPPPPGPPTDPPLSAGGMQATGSEVDDPFLSLRRQ